MKDTAVDHVAFCIEDSSRDVRDGKRKDFDDTSIFQ